MALDPTTVNSFPGLNIALGQDPGLRIINRFGCNSLLDNGDSAEVWNGGINGRSYVFPTIAETNFISCADDADKQDYLISGLDENHKELEVIQTANGQTTTEIGVDKLWIRINKVKNLGATGNDNAGHVHVHTGGATAVTLGEMNAPDLPKLMASVEAGENESQMAIYTIPAGKKGVLVYWYGGIDNKQVSGASDIKLRVRDFGSVFRTVAPDVSNVSGTSTIQRSLLLPEVINEKSDIVIMAGSNTNGLSVAAGFSIILVDK